MKRVNWNKVFGYLILYWLVLWFTNVDFPLLASFLVGVGIALLSTEYTGK